MTREASNDIIICALLVSLVLHVGGMLWVRPKVMTTVASGAERVQRRGPMQARITNEERPEPVKIDVISDVEPEAKAPQVAPTVAVVPAAGEDTPLASELRVPEVQIPEVVSRIAPGEMPLPIPVDQVSPSVPIENEKMLSDTLSVANLAKADAFAVAPVTDISIAPTISVAPQQIDEPPKVVEPPKLTNEKKEGEKPFEPILEVMPKIDEAVVEREKEAVRDLVDVSDAAELAPFVSVVMSSKVEGPWRYFKLLMMPKSSLKVVPKDVVVVIDASGSIGRDRMRSIRLASKRILRSLTNSDDRFNMVAFRDRFSYAFKRWQSCTVQSFDAADDWLDDVVPHGRTDVFSTIASILTLPRDPSRPMIALVVTDGDANAGVKDTSEIVSKFTKLNDGLVSIYMYGVKSAANRQLIDALTRANRGESFVFEGGRSKAGSGIDGLSERFRDPVLSDIRIVFSAASKAEVYPRRLKNMYRGETLEVVGRTPSSVSEVAFSLRGLNGSQAYEGFFKFPVTSMAAGSGIAEEWRNEQALGVILQ